MQVASAPPSFQDVAPFAGPWIDSLGHSPLAASMQVFIAEIEIPHLMGLFMLAGVSLVVNLRLMGVGVREVAASDLWRGLRIWFHIGLAMVLISGLALGVTSAPKLYSSVAFLIKMISLLAAVILTYGVTAPVARADGEVTGSTRAALIAGLFIWLAAVALFITQIGVNPGMIHLMTAAGLIGLAAMRGQLKWAMIIGLCLIFAVWQAVTHLVILEGTSQADLDRYMAANKLFMYLTGGWIFGAVALSILGKAAGEDASRMTRMIAYVSILAWVTVAAAGRWIAFAS